MLKFAFRRPPLLRTFCKKINPNIEKINELSKIYTQIRKGSEGMAHFSHVFKEEQRERMRLKIKDSVNDYLKKEKYNPVIHEEQLMSVLTMISFADNIDFLDKDGDITNVMSRTVERMFDIKDPFLKITIYSFCNKYNLQLSEDAEYNLIATMQNIASDVPVQSWISILGTTHAQKYEKFKQIFKDFEYKFIEYFLESSDPKRFIYLVQAISVYRQFNYGIKSS